MYKYSVMQSLYLLSRWSNWNQCHYLQRTSWSTPQLLKGGQTLGRKIKLTADAMKGVSRQKHLIAFTWAQ